MDLPEGLRVDRGVRAQWEKSSATPSLSEFMMGHIIDKNGYNKAPKDHDWAMDEYEKALPFLNILSNPTAHGYADRDEVTELKERMRELEIDYNKLGKKCKEDIEAITSQKNEKNVRELMNEAGLDDDTIFADIRGEVRFSKTD